MLLSELAARLGLKLQGEDGEFSGLNTLDAATESEVSFLANPKYAHLLGQTRALAVIVSEAHVSEGKTVLISDNPYLDFARAASFFVRQESSFTGISPLAVIHPDAVLGSGCTVHPFAHVGARTILGDACVLFPGAYIGEDCVFGKGCVLYPNSVALSGVLFGDNCVLQPGAVAGTDGFGFIRVAGQMQKIPQIGTVQAGDRVEFGANSCVDRSTLGATRVGDDTKLDNLVQIGHNVSLGEQCLIISQVGIAGSTKVGDRVTMAGQAGIAGHLSIGDDVVIGPQAGVAKDIAAGVSGSGSPFVDSRTYLRSTVVMPKLPELSRRVSQLEKELAALKQLMAAHSDSNGTEDE